MDALRGGGGLRTDGFGANVPGAWIPAAGAWVPAAGAWIPAGALRAIAFLCGFLALGALGGCDRPPDLDEEPAPPPVAGSPVDSELADAGEAWYRFRGCMACHTIGGGRSMGPDLAGVTERRAYDWYRGMVVEPDSMLRDDPVARELLEQYRTPMPDTGVNDAQARAIFEYLRMRDREG